MKEQKLEFKSEVFNPKHIFECGQCFRWNLEKDGNYVGIVRKNVIKVQKTENKITIISFGEDDLPKLCEDYFDQQRDYQEIQKKLGNVDQYLKNSIAYGKGIRILKQDLWEVIISFLISANNNIPRIKGIIERISKAYGEKIQWNEKDYYCFPSPEELQKASIQQLRELGLGFRDKRVYEVTKMVVSGKINLEELKNNQNTNEVRKKLEELPGVGPKVADCILLFGMQRFEVFPVDVWVRRVMNELYLKQQEEKVKNEEIQELAKRKYKNLAGIAQQYLFYWKREIS